VLDLDLLQAILEVHVVPANIPEISYPITHVWNLQSEVVHKNTIVDVFPADTVGHV
jgi:hypothetical protein